MESSLQLFGYLILTFLGVVVPLLIILLSIFQEGVSKLTTQYEKEKSNSEENLKTQLKKLAEAGNISVKEIGQSIKNLEVIKKKAKTKLSYLNPKKQTLILFVLLLISFIGVILAILKNVNIYGLPVFIVISLILFALVLHLSWKQLCIIIEVKKIVDRDKNEMETKTLEFLSTIAKKGEDYFLKDVFIRANEVDINNDEEVITLSFANMKHSVDMCIRNGENRMAKKVQIGIVFPKNFIVEKTGSYSIYLDSAGEQYVRYSVDSIHGNTSLIIKPLQITPMEVGEFVIRTFIKAENIETTNHFVKFIVAAEMHGSS